MATSVPKLLPSQQAAVADVLAENEAKGTRTYTFNPDATTQEKAAIAGKAKSSLGLPPSLTKSDAAVGALSEYFDPKSGFNRTPWMVYATLFVLQRHLYHVHNIFWSWNVDTT